MNKIRLAAVLAIISVAATGCMMYLTQDRSEVLLPGVDIDQTLDIAAIDLRRGRWGSALTLWAIRDQIINPRQAGRISLLYFNNIDRIRGRFNMWHFTWAIADIYRLGDAMVRDSMQKAFDDARVRVKSSYRLANRFVNEEKLYMGDAHFLGRAYAHRHVVVPGNEKYVQSVGDFLK